MKKRIIAVLCIVALITVSLTACSLFGGGKKTTINGVEVEEQQYHQNNTDCVFLIMTNKTENDCDYEVSVNFLDNNGNTVDSVKDYTIYAVAKDTTIAQPFYSDKPYTSLNYIVVTKPLDFYRAVDGGLKTQFNTNGEKMDISVTNDGNEAAQYVEYYILYYKGNELAGYDNGYCIDDNNEIKPGATVNSQEQFDDPYDKAKIYIHGRSESKY